MKLVKRGDGEDGKKDGKREAEILMLQESLAEEPGLQCQAHLHGQIVP